MNFKMLKHYPHKIEPIASKDALERKVQSWLGGSILGSMPSFDQFLMKKKEYEEHGPKLIERKSFK